MVKNRIKINSKIFTKILGARGVTLVEVVICVAIFTVLSVSIYGVFTSIINGIVYYRQTTIISSLADQYLETMRNMSYSQIGTMKGNPHGVLADLPDPISTTVDGIQYQIYYAISYVDDPSDGTILAGTDPYPDDYKQVKLYIKNVSTGVTSNFITNVVPKGLEGLTSGGALSIQVINAVGQPVSGATIQIKNTSISPNINVTRTADANGKWIEVGLPDSSNNYNVTVTKSGYSTDQTYPISAQNPNPTKPDATISNGQVTAVSFAIDQLGNLVFNTLNAECAPIPGVGLEIRGSKLIGTSPNIFKFDNSYTSNSNGQAALNNIEWDTYTPALTGNSYMIYGSSPIQQVSILPNTNQNFNLILGSATANSLLVLVKDSSTNNSIQGAEVDLHSGSNITTEYTGGSIWTQQSWAGGSGQTDFNDNTKYYQDDGSISNNIIPLGLRLIKNGNFYVSSGSLESSSFDTGTTSTTYTTLTWQPTSQDPSTTVKFQIAANNDDTTWNYIGPDGTNQTYYATPGTTISSLNNKRYVRYKAYLSTTDTSKTPVLTSVNVNYVSGCSSPGQTMFSSLQAGSAYSVIVSLSGYQTFTYTIGSLPQGYNVASISLSR